LLPLSVLLPGEVNATSGQNEAKLHRLSSTSTMAKVSVRYIVVDVDAAIDFYCRELDLPVIPEARLAGTQ
jgi:hypothetical protein